LRDEKRKAEVLQKRQFKMKLSLEQLQQVPTAELEDCLPFISFKKEDFTQVKEIYETLKG